VRPILKKQIIHQGKNVLLVLKSIEVKIFEEVHADQAPSFKQMTPLYVPIDQVRDYTSLSKQKLEGSVVKSLYSLREIHKAIPDESTLKRVNSILGMEVTDSD
jgi:hypothetical protein